MSLLDQDSRKTVCSRFEFVDLFGSSVNFGIRGKKKMTSQAGIVISLLAMILFASFFIVRTIKLLESDDPVIQHTVVNNEGEEIDLWKLGYFFAITEIDPRIATLKVTHTSWDAETGKTKNPI